jgi:RNA-binding protein
MAALSIHERKRLRQIGHALNPVVMIGGQGLNRKRH